MMDMVFTKEDYEQIADIAEKFADDYIRPYAEELDNKQKFPNEIYEQMGQLGLLGITVPAALGGVGMDCRSYAIVMEALSRGYASVADQCGLVELVGSLLSQYGSAQQQEKYLAPLLRAEKFAAYCITEAEAGSDVKSIKTKAVKTEGGWEISGEKLWIHNAPIADFAVVLAVTDASLGHKGMSIFIVDCDKEGVSAGPKEEKMGQRASQVSALLFDKVKLDEDAYLGEIGRGFYMMMSVLEKGRIGIASLAVGIAEASLQAAVEYAKSRKQFNQAISAFQGVQFILADMAKDIQAARLLVRDAALKMDEGLAATAASSMAKCFASDMAVKHTANGVQIFGGSGYIRGFEVERLYRDAKITQIYEGTNQIQRLIIARDLLKD